MRGPIAISLGLALAACSSAATQALDSYPPARLKTADDAKQWAAMSAVSIYIAGLATYSTAAGADVTGAGCPSRSDDGTTVRILGGCTTELGDVWSGSVRYQRLRTSDGSLSDAGFGTYTYDGLSVRSTASCDGGTFVSTATYDGTVTLTGDERNATFSLDLRVGALGACTSAPKSRAYVYTGTFAGDGGTTTWNGSGRAGSSAIGVASVSTKDEVIDSSACSHEAVSGTTTARSVGDALVITYDGATKCDDTGTVRWSLNGADRGELSGVHCGAAPGDALGLAPFAAWAGVLRRWRRRRR